MKKNTFKSLLFFGLMLCSLCIIAQDSPPSDGVFRLRNVETGQFLTDAGVSATPVTMTDSGEPENTHWTFVVSGSFYNIDSETFGILRAPGSGGPGGPYVVLSTGIEGPDSASDKIWTIHYDDLSDTYRFESNLGRYLYHEADGSVTHASVPDTDDRSNWELILFEETFVEVAPDEDTDPDISCSSEFTNPDRTGPDLPNPVNVGAIDDRTCYSDYSESSVYGETWGVYNITYDSNHLDTTLQPRMERSLSRSQETGVGSYARFTGTVRILEVGDTTGTSNDGSYIMQAKGKHTGGGGSPDPAICLFLAKPVYGADENGNQVQASFDLYREQINYRGGEGAEGRTIVYLTNIEKNVQTDIELEVGFREDPNDPNLKIHYADAVIGGVAFNWNIPEPERGEESGIRYGAYRVKGGRAQIRWANTTYQKAEVVDSGGSDPADDIYRLRNVETGQFLTDAGVSATPVTMSDSGETQNTHWTFVESGSFFNIDSETNGILRAPGSGGPGGPYVVLSTGVEGPDGASDKIWAIHYDELSDTYRFESNLGRYLYHEADGSVTHASVPETDNRSVWQAIPTSESLSLDENQFLSSAVKVFPNPANDNFTIALKNIDNVKVKIFDVLGKTIFESQSTGKNLQINNDGRFKSGIYLIKVIDNTNNVYHTRLVIK